MLCATHHWPVGTSVAKGQALNSCREAPNGGVTDVPNVPRLGQPIVSVGLRRHNRGVTESPASSHCRSRKEQMNFLHSE